MAPVSTVKGSTPSGVPQASEAEPKVSSVAEWRIEQIRIGQTASFETLVTQKSIQDFARLTGDYSPLHTDPQSARRTRFRGPIAHGMLADAYISTLVGMYLPGKYATLVSHRARYLKPVRPGDRLTILGTVVAKQEVVGLVELKVTITNQRGETVIEGDVEALVNPPPKKGVSMLDLTNEHLTLDFGGQVALITGASRGIGEATAKLFAYHGARVIINYFQGTDDAEAAVADIERHGAQAIALQADVRDPAQVRRMVEAAIRRFGAVHILVNNAMNQATPQSFEQTSWDDVQADLDVALKGAFHCIQAVLPTMLRQGSGKIISLTTVYTNGTPPPGFARYIAAKSALLGLTRALAVEYASKNISFNVVSPGFTDTDLASHVPDAIKRKMAAEIPSRRIGEPLDIAKAIVIMASRYTDYVVGNQLLVCGGSTMI